MTTTDFSSLPLKPAMLANLKTLGYREMTPIQAASLPVILNQQDLIAQAKTGSGKTAAFGIGLLSRLNVRHFQVQALVLCPTRELADQVGKEIRRLARFTHNVKVLTLCGGMPLGPQIGSLEHGAHIVVGTPGRIMEHLRKGSLALSSLKTLVLDEADRMLDMGFLDSINTIIEQAPADRQTLLFSATYSEGIRRISGSIQSNPVAITVESHHSHSDIDQRFYEVENAQRLPVLAKLLSHYQPASTVVFCNTKRLCQEVADDLQQRGFQAQALHGDLEQRARDQVLVGFSNRSCSVLVATDVAARGLDIKELEAVINLELSRDPEVHVHRIGRTGRAGQTGLALSLFSGSEHYKLLAIEANQPHPLTIERTDTLKVDAPIVFKAPMVTLCIDGGRKNKVRPGDILGALTGKDGIAGTEVGKIDIFDFCAYVAVKRAVANRALKHLAAGKIKGRSFKVRKLR